MAQKRMLSRRLAVSKSIHALKGNDRARFLYTLLLPYTDRAGRINANPDGLKGSILEPFEYTTDDIQQALHDLAQAGLLILYSTAEYKLVAQYARFSDFNTPHPNEPPSDFPDPESEEAENADADVLHASPASLSDKDGFAGSLSSPTPFHSSPTQSREEGHDEDSAEARFARARRNGQHEPYDANRVRATIRRLAGAKFAKQHESDLTTWARWTNEQLERLWADSRLDKWPELRKAGKHREWIFEDLLHERRTPPGQATEPDRDYSQPITGADLLDDGPVEGSWKN